MHLVKSQTRFRGFGMLSMTESHRKGVCLLVISYFEIFSLQFMKCSLARVEVDRFQEFLFPPESLKLQFISMYFCILVCYGHICQRRLMCFNKRFQRTLVVLILKLNITLNVKVIISFMQVATETWS